jgi:hypothetical protein
MQRGFTNSAGTQPLAQKGKAGFAQGKAMAEQRKKPTDKAVGGTTNSDVTGPQN